MFPAFPWKLPRGFPVKVTYKKSTKKNAKKYTKTYTCKTTVKNVSFSVKASTKTKHDFSLNPYACGALNCYYKKIAAPGIDTVGGQDLEWDYVTYVNGKEKYYAAVEFTAIFGEKLIIPYTLLCGENVKMSIIDPETGMKIIPQQMVSYTKDSVVMDFQTPQFQTQFENQYGKCGRYEFILRAHNELGNYEAYYNSDVRFFINLPHETDEWQMNRSTGKSAPIRIAQTAVSA